jgi:hypothetical protein
MILNVCSYPNSIASSGNVLEMHILQPTPDSLIQKLEDGTSKILKILRGFDVG